MATYNGTSAGANSWSTPDGAGVTIGPGTVDDVLFGNAGDDTLQGYAGSDWLSGGTGNDSLCGDTKSLAAVSPGDAGDYLYGEDGNDLLMGQAGDDSLDGGSGFNTINGGDGIDLAAYIGATEAVTVDLAAGTATAGAYATDTITAVENLGGSHFDDQLFGDGGDNRFTGFGGDDTLDGRDGSDTAVFTGDRSFYTVTFQLDGTLLVTDNRSQQQIELDSVHSIYQVSNGTDSLAGFEFLQFKDGTYSLAQLLPDDFADSANDFTLPQGQMGFGVGATGTIEATGDAVSFEVVLAAGVQYTFDLEGSVTGMGTIPDPFLGLFDGTMAFIMSDDDGGDGTNSRFIFTPATSGLYFLVASGFASTIGTYTITTTLNATAGNDTVRGTFLSDDISLLGGNDLATAGFGRDTVYGGNGGDQLLGGGDNDFLYGGNGADSLVGSKGNDLLAGEDGKDSLYGGIDNDQLGGGIGDDLINGSDGIDVVTFVAGGVSVTVDLSLLVAQNTGLGLDTLIGIENLVSGTGNDKLIGDAAANEFRSGFGDDTLVSWEGDDSLYGEDGDDQLGAGIGNDLIDGGLGSDTAVFTVGGFDAVVDLQILGGQATGYGFDSLISIENLLSGSGNDSLRGDAFDNALTSGTGDDTLVGSEGNDRLYGGDGNDLLGAGLDNDLIDGGSGTDTATFGAGGAPARVNLTIVGAQNTGYGLDVLVSIENLVSGSGRDVLTGNGFANALSSGAGNDKLIGGTGNDTLTGGSGNDTQTGGGGADTFVFDSALGLGNIDQLVGFNASLDAFRLDQSIFTDIALGVMAAAAFRANTAGMARDASDRIIYDTDSGFLFYDVDGNGAASRVLLATLDVGLSLMAPNFTIEA